MAKVVSRKVRKPVKNSVKKLVKNLVKKSVKKSAKPLAKKLVRKTAKKSAKKSAKKTAKKSAKKSTTTTYKSWHMYKSEVRQFALEDAYIPELTKALAIKASDLQGGVGTQLPLSILPDMSFRIYSSNAYHIAKQYVDVPFDKVPKLARVYMPIYFNDYKTLPSGNDRLYISNAYKKRLNTIGRVEGSCRTKKCIALTFDDGPDEVVTTRLLDILKTKSVKVTFFVLGNHVVRYPEVVKRAHNEGHEIENHSFDHPDFVKLRNPAKIRQQIDATQKAVQDTGVGAPLFIRPPYGAVSPDIEKVVGMPIVLWNVDAQEWRAGTSSQAVVAAILDKARNGSIVLMHDTRSVTLEVLPQVIDDLLLRDYEFVTVQSLLSIDANTKGKFDSAP
jgi:peptidoglycan/xylan/chitin deacetylase (PgdA/CDA1 family)